MAATHKGALRPAQISKKYLAGARATVADNGGVGPKGRSNGIVGSVVGLDLCLHSSVMWLGQRPSDVGRRFRRWELSPGGDLA